MSRTSHVSQSVAGWCLSGTEWNWTLEQVCETARELEIRSIELLTARDLPVLQRFDLECALGMNGMPDPPFVKGLNNPKYHDEVITRTKEAIDEYKRVGVPNVIAFTGYKWRDASDPSSDEISRQEGLDNCVKGLSELADYARGTGVTICLEHLNTRDGSHPMKGHPGYQGDDLAFCAEIIERVGSPSVKLLFDFYHVQIMHGDVIRRFRQLYPLIGHVHTAGNPGRGPLDDRQEIYYAAIFRTLAEVGYTGYIGHEFIPVKDARQELADAVELCGRFFQAGSAD